MKPYGSRSLTLYQGIFNYHLSRARKIVENAFGILASRFRIFLSPILLKLENAEKILLPSCVLHNYLRTKSPNKVIHNHNYWIVKLMPKKFLKGNNKRMSTIP